MTGGVSWSVMAMSWPCHGHVMAMSWPCHDVMGMCTCHHDVTDRHHDILWHVIMTSWRDNNVSIFYHEGKFIEITDNISKHMLSIDQLQTTSHALSAISLFLVLDKTAFWFLAVRLCCRFRSASSTVQILGLGLG